MFIVICFLIAMFILGLIVITGREQSHYEWRNGKRRLRSEYMDEISRLRENEFDWLTRYNDSQMKHRH